jgi:hypothetical protein
VDDVQVLATEKAHQNRAIVDPWTAVHFSTGLALGLMDLPFEGCFGAALAYEVAEQVVERQKWGKEFFNTSRPETLLNAGMDMAAFALGHWLGGVWNRTGRRRGV